MNDKDLALILFKNKKKLVDHYKKHGKHTEADNPGDYLRRANEVMSKGYWSPAKRGKVRFTLPDTKEHVIYDPKDNKILSYYIRKAFLEGAI